MNSEAYIKFRWLFAIILVNYILQSTIFQAIKINGISANFTLVLVIVITIIYGLISGLFTAVLAGLLVDVFLSMTIGINLLILVIIATLISIVARPLFTGNKLTLIFMTGLSTALYHLIYFFFMYFLNEGMSFTAVMSGIVPYEIIMNSIVCVIMYTIGVRWIERHKLD